MPPAEQPRIGDPAPAAELELLDHRGARRRIGELRGHNVVLYFYPRDETPGCTVEGKEFREAYDDLAALNCEVLGVSTDSVESHRRFAEKHAFPFALLSDPGGELARAYGVMREGAAARATFVLDHELKVRRAFEDVRPRGHAQQVLGFVRTMLESHRMLGG